MKTQIKHYGVKGMRWGVRKSKSKNKRRSKNVRKMSDDQLKKAIKRMNLERDYKRLIKEKNGNPIFEDVKKEVKRAIISKTVQATISYGTTKFFDVLKNK